MFYNDTNANFKDFDFLEWFDLNSDSSSLLEILSIKAFLVDFLDFLNFIYQD